MAAATGWTPLSSLEMRHGSLMIAPNHGLAVAFLRNTLAMGFLQSVVSSDGLEGAYCSFGVPLVPLVGNPINSSLVVDTS
jgi:hypothetical protein